MTRNMGTADRIIRAVVGAVAVVLAFLAGAGSGLGIVLLIVAVLMLGTAAVGFCPVYVVLRMSTIGGVHRQTTKV
jgi:hypothetical protein